MVLMIVSGRSGSGKSVALRALEDRGIDNQIRSRTQRLQQIAFFVDSTFQRQVFAGKRMQSARVTVTTN